MQKFQRHRETLGSSDSGNNNSIRTYSLSLHKTCEFRFSQMVTKILLFKHYVMFGKESHAVNNFWLENGEMK